LFEFKMSYLESGYHKPGEKPFIFPPADVEPTIDANLVEIEGKNGTGKTTLLNVLALALGYLDRLERDKESEKELEYKSGLKRRLEDLDRNETLQYRFRISIEKPQPLELLIEREKGQKQRILLNSKSTSPENLVREFDILFLTEDDPKKVVTASKGKLTRFFLDLDNRLNTLSHTITKYMIEMDEFSHFKKNEKELLEEIKDHTQKIAKHNSEVEKLKETLIRVESRNDIQKKLALLNNEEKITSDYNRLGKKYEQLKGKTDTDIFRKIYRERAKLVEVENNIKNISANVIQSCTSLGHYGVILNGDKLLHDDLSDLNRLLTRRELEKRTEIAKMAIVDEMISLLSHHSEKDIVPLINKPVGEVLRELYKVKAQLSFDRVFALLGALKTALNERRTAIGERDRITEKISALSKDSKDIKDLESVEKEFLEAQERYLQLQQAQQEDKIKLTAQWRLLRSVEGVPEVIRSQFETLEIQSKAEESMKVKCEERLRVLRQNAKEEPKFKGKEKRLQTLSKDIVELRESLSHWKLILDHPAEAREQFASVKTKIGFGLNDYQRFVKAVGEFLGNQFEPVVFANRLHEVKFFDIEKYTFITKENRQIPIDNLSQGQSKITTLTGSFKELGEGRKKIVLVDEIADLDPENLQRVKDTLKEKFAEGKLALAVLVRPSHDPTSKAINIKGWS